MGPIVKAILVSLLLFSGLACAQTNSVKQPMPVPAPQPFGSLCTYSNPASTARGGGWTELTYTVTPEYNVVDATVLGRSGDDDLDMAAIQCVAVWRIDQSNIGQGATIGPHRGTIMWRYTRSDPDTFFGTFQLREPSCGTYYPPIAARLGIEGTAFVTIRIMTDGSVRGAAISQSSGNRDLDDAAVSCIKFWRFHPALQNGNPVEVTKQFAIKFKLAEASPPAKQ